MKLAYQLRGAIGALAMLGSAAIASSASAATLNCPGTASTADREYTLLIGGSPFCSLTGTGNPTAGTIFAATGFTEIDNDTFPTQTGGTGNTDNGFTVVNASATDQAGTFTFTGLQGSFASFGLLLEGNTPGLDPDFAFFTFAASPTNSAGSFSISAGNFTQVSLFGSTTPVPGPLAGAGIVPLLGFGLVALRRRRQRLAA